ncbi:porin family protein [Salinimicrobium sediminilitoris]|uniref:porin family protein n=1 Tax=Salinimicrobium sediminilitoris TaxID=2876715 RepID=UPI001E61F431|nr:porin family protein [Salinimicrobium sediminilitoris]MCC8359180.1 PorT family protein [Salinimicrobium sediminilitoris]
MKNLFLITLFALICASSFSQVIFEKGFIIHQTGQTSTSYIKFNELAGNPDKVQYKTAPDSEVQSAGTEAIKGFGIGDYHRYTRETLNIDRSSEDLDNISGVRNPIFQEETIFLRTLLAGNYSLLYYQDGELKRFFIKKPSGEVEQLVFKKYTTGDNIVRKNNRYKQQLMNLLLCDNLSENDLKNLQYNRTDLMDIFQKYFKCTNSSYDTYYFREKGDLNLMVKAGVNFSNFGMEQDVHNIVEEFQYQVDPKIGLEIEYILPMVNRKVAVYLEPSFSKYQADQEIIVATKESTPSNPNATGGYKALVNMDYKILDLPMGLRYYMYMDKANSLKMYINVGASINKIFNSSTILNKADNEISDFDFNQSWQPTFFAGAGYRYSEKISLEIRYFPVRPLADNGGYKLHQNHSFAIVAGYTLF